MLAGVRQAVWILATLLLLFLLIVLGFNSLSGELYFRPSRLSSLLAPLVDRGLDDRPRPLLFNIF